MNFLIIGYGNPLRGDDGVGWVVAERLREVEGVTAVAAHQLLPEQADLIQQAAHVLFVDATVHGEPGEIRVQNVIPHPAGSASSHQMAPAVLLALTEKVYGRCPAAHLITITGQNFGFGEGLSPLIQSKLAQICGVVLPDREQQT